MKKIVSLIVRAPVFSLVLAFLVTGLLASRLGALEINVSPRLLMVGSDPAVKFYEDSKDRFGSDELTMIVYKADDVFTSNALQSIARISNDVRDIPEVGKVDSLATVNNVRADGDNVSTGPLVQGMDLEDPADLALIKKYALDNPVYVGKILAPDARMSAILVYTASDSDDLDFSKRFKGQVDALIDAEIERTGLDIYQVGRPYRQAIQGATLLSDQKSIWPVGLLVILGVLIAIFRKPVPIFIALLARLLTILWAVGFMATLGYPISMLSALIPLLLISVGITEDVHIVSEYRERLALGDGKREAIAETMDNLATPLLVTSLTTGVGFASLGLSPITILHQLGITAALGFLSSFVVTLLVVPSMLQLVPAGLVRGKERVETSDSEPGAVLRVLLAMAGTSLRRRGWVLAASAVVFVVAGVGLLRAHVDNDIMGFFREGTEIRQRVQEVHERLAGVPIFYIVVEAGEDGQALEPSVLRQIDGLQRFLAETGEVDETITITDFLKVVHRAMNGGDDAMYVLPDSAALASQYLVLLHPTEVEQYLDFGHRAASVLVRHNITSTRQMKKLLAQIEAYAETEMPFLRVTPAAETILTTRAADELATSMVAGMGLTILIVAAVCALFFASIYAALLSLVPNLLPIGVVFGVAGWFGIPINVGTSMVAAIAIGIAVDDTIHYMSRNSIELDRHHDPTRAMVETVTAEGRVIVATSLALAGGFLVFSLSSFVPLANFGILAAITMGVALLCDLTVTPALMGTARLVTLWNVVGLTLGGDITTISPLFKGLSRWEARRLVLTGRLTHAGPGEKAVRRGDTDPESLFVVLRGNLEVRRSADDADAPVLAKLDRGEVFGEMAAIDGGERSADVIATEASEVLVLSSEDIASLANRHPRIALKIHRNLNEILTSRLRDTTTMLVGD